MSARNHMQAVYKLLSGESTITALVGSKVFPVTEPQQDGYPVIVYSQLNEERIESKDGPILNGHRFTIDIYAESYSECHSIAQATKTLLEWYNGTVDGVQYAIRFTDQQDQDFEDETQTFGIVQDYSLEVL